MVRSEGADHRVGLLVLHERGRERDRRHRAARGGLGDDSGPHAGPRGAHLVQLHPHRPGLRAPGDDDRWAVGQRRQALHRLLQERGAAPGEIQEELRSGTA